jgi:hypothetical protein
VLHYHVGTQFTCNALSITERQRLAVYKTNTNPNPNPNSYAGSAAFVLSAFIVCFGVLSLLSATGIYTTLLFHLFPLLRLCFVINMLAEKKHILLRFNPYVVIYLKIHHHHHHRIHGGTGCDEQAPSTTTNLCSLCSC